MEFDLTALDFLAIAALWGALSPLIVSLLKNIGSDWPKGAKQGVAFVLAIVGGFVAVGTSAGWGEIDLTSGIFWQALVTGVAGVFAVQYSFYQGLWEDTRVDKALTKVGTTQE